MNDHYKVDGWTDLERAAQGILAKEAFDAAVAKRVAELRLVQSQSPWQRLINKLPFIITWRSKT